MNVGNLERQRGGIELIDLQFPTKLLNNGDRKGNIKELKERKSYIKEQ